MADAYAISFGEFHARLKYIRDEESEEDIVDVGVTYRFTGLGV